MLFQQDTVDTTAQKKYTPPYAPHLSPGELVNARTANTDPAKKSEPPALAYSYVRFSTPEQAKGDSLRRQVEAAANWCAKSGVKLDTSTTLHDLGKSAYLGEHRKNPDRHALAAFLKLIEAGKVPRGSYLVVENLDRLSREHLRAAVTLFLSIQESGINIVTTSPEKVYRHDSQDMIDIIIAVVELSRGHSESAVKSERVGAAWAEKKAAAAAGKPQPVKRQNRVNGMSIITHMLPAWVREVGGKLELIPEAADAVRRVYELARNGYGQVVTAQKMRAEKVKPIGYTDHWTRPYISILLSDRRAVGDFQPRKRDGSADGEPIKGYFPAVVTEAEWQAARNGAASRRQPGKKNAPPNGSLTNLFAGLLKDARDGGTYSVAQRVDKGRRWWVLLNTRSVAGLTKCVSLAIEPFERAILSHLREINPRELLGDTGAPSESAALAAELAREESDIARLETELEKGGENIPSVVRVLGKKEARRKELAEALAVKRAEEATPVSASWGEFQTLVDVLDTATDREDARRRLQAALRRVVAGIWLLIVPRGRSRIAAVRVLFAGCEKARDYLLVYTPPIGNWKTSSPANLRSYSFRQRANVSVMNIDPTDIYKSVPDTIAFSGVDLREPKDAAEVEEVLARWDVTKPLTDIIKGRVRSRAVREWFERLEIGNA